LRGRLIGILVLLAAAAVTSGYVMLALFRQSATAQIGQSEALAGRACDAIGQAYRFYTAGWQAGEPDLNDPALRRGLSAVVVTALRDRPGIEGGLWQTGAGSLVYAFPTYEGSGPKTDLPAAELPRIRATNQAVTAEDRPQLARVDSASQTLLIAACPMAGPIPALTAWTMTRVHTLGGPEYRQLMAGLTILSLAVIGASILAGTLIMTWSRHVGRIETVLGKHEIGDLPVLPKTGERELDRIILSLNDAGQRLKASRAKAEHLSQQVAASDRLAAIGRVAAGVAHEIRNPIAAMRLKAEMAFAGTIERKDQALAVVIGQVDRLDRLVHRLLTVSERDPPQLVEVAMMPFLTSCADLHRELAADRDVTIEAHSAVARGRFDPLQMGRAVDNLVLNAIEAARGSVVRLSAMRTDTTLVLAVSNDGDGPPEALRDHLFEPFVTGRADGTGLGLSIVREIAEAHGGTARFRVVDRITTFEIEIPWRTS
jgi:hypothetical protein